MRKVLLALVLIVVLCNAAFAARVEPMLTEVMKDAKGLIPVIVQMNPGAKQMDVAGLGGKPGFTYAAINGFSAELPVAAIHALAKNPNIFAISFDRPVYAEVNTAVCTVRSDLLRSEGYTGSGIGIAVMDTGIYPHSDFQGRIIAFKDFINNRTTPYDDNGHGTMCAGIAAGNGPVYKGAATAANLIGVKVLNSSGSGSISTILNGLQWCIDNRTRYGIKIISMSLGASVTQSSTTDPMCGMVRNAVYAGLTVITTAGASSQIGCPGNEPLSITVSTSNDNGTCDRSDDTMPSFAPTGPTPIDGWMKPDLVAPGVNITSCDNGTGYVTMSGTSMSTALVAGVCAQILHHTPTLTPAQVKIALMATAYDLGYSVYKQGAGLVDAYAAAHY